MAQRLIEHPLRTLNLVFSDQLTETSADTVMLDRYLELHDSFLALRKQYAKLRFEYLELSDTMQDVVNAFNAREAEMNALLDEGEVLLTKVKRADAINDLLERMANQNPDIQSFHNDKLLPLASAIEALNVPWIAFNTVDESFEDLFIAYEKEVEGPFYKEAETRAIDFNTYFDDMEDLKGHLDKQDQMHDVDDIITAYDGLVSQVNALYARWAAAQENIYKFFAEDDMLDRSLSEACAKNELPIAEQPIYLVAPNDKLITQFAATYGLLADKTNNTLVINIPPEVVVQMQNAMVQEIIIALQHFPRLMEKMLFSIDFRFTNEFGGEMEEADWKGMEPPVRWINGFSTLPATYFFLADHDVRSYFLMGDLVFDGKVKVEEDNCAKVEGEALDILGNRVFNTCWFFMLYCHNTGIDPTPHIQRMLDEMNLPITMESIREEYEDSIAKGIQLQMMPTKHNK